MESAKTTDEIQNPMFADSRRCSLKSLSFTAGLIVAVALGAFLRLYLLPDQILLDDEWHGMNHSALINSFSGVLTRFSLNLATSIPLNVYDYLLFKTIGWNETWLRLPSIFAGAASLIVFPMLVRNLFNRRITLIFAALLAISPFLIFYSRMARPYSLVTLFGFTAIWSLYLWATRGGKQYAILYVVCSCLAICFHLFATVAVILPLGVVFAVALRDRFRKAPLQNPTTYPGLIAMTIAAALVTAVALVFAVSGLTSSAAPKMVGKDRMTIETFSGFASLLSGTANPIFIISFFVLLALGLLVMWKEKPLLPGILISALLSYFAAFILIGPTSIHESIVVTRYATTLFPLGLLFAAAGMDAIARYAESRKSIERSYVGRFGLSVACILFVAGLFASGPLPSIYSAPNNFTNHSVFQDSYKRRTWEQSYVTGPHEQFYSIRKEDISTFYWQLAKEPNGSIIEFPMPFVNVFNLYYYYQHFHQKRVLIGYLARVDVSKTGYFIWVDGALSIAPEPSKFRFRNMVNLEDIPSIRSSGAKYVILHTNLLGDEWKQHFNYPRQDYSVLTNFLRESFVRAFGLPVFRDKNIIVFEIRPM